MALERISGLQISGSVDKEALKKKKGNIPLTGHASPQLFYIYPFQLIG